MTRRRGWGSVTRYAYKPGWRARAGDDARSPIGIYLDEDFGGRVQSRAAAEEALDEARRAWLQQHAPKGRGAVLVAYGRDVLNRWEVAGTRRGIDRDRTRFERHIATAPFGEDPVASIEHRQIQRWVRALAAGVAEGPRGDGARKRSRRTVLNILNLLRSILREAIEDEIIDESPASNVIVPRTPTMDEDFLLLEIAEADLVFGAAPSEFVPLSRLSAYQVAIAQGLRPGELWGLHWEDVPRGPKGGVKLGELVVRRNRKRATKGGRVRRIPLLEPARAALDRWWHAERARLERAPRADELVWSPDGRHAYAEGHDARWAHQHQNKRGRRWTQLGGRWHLGILRDVPLKDLRHTCACALLRGWWIERGWIDRRLSLLEVSQWLGHRSITTTEKHYARLAPGGLLDVVLESRERPTSPRSEREGNGSKRRSTGSQRAGATDKRRTNGPTRTRPPRKQNPPEKQT